MSSTNDIPTAYLYGTASRQNASHLNCVPIYSDRELTVSSCAVPCVTVYCKGWRYCFDAAEGSTAISNSTGHREHHSSFEPFHANPMQTQLAGFLTLGGEEERSSAIQLAVGNSIRKRRTIKRNGARTSPVWQRGYRGHTLWRGSICIGRIRVVRELGNTVYWCEAGSLLHKTVSLRVAKRWVGEQAELATVQLSLL